jgi:hypothetical protein
VWFERRNYLEPRKSEVGHCARGRTNVERVARRNQDDFQAVALVFSEQEMIVEPPPIAASSQLKI